MTSERRSYLSTFEPVAGKKLVGYAAVFDSPTVIAEGGRTWTEIVRPGAFRKAIETKGDIVSTYNHDPSKLLGRTSSGTLTLHEDSHGLRFTIDLPDTGTGNEVRALVERGDLRGASFMFSVRKGGESWDGNTRTLSDLYLMELGPVTMPAYQATSIGLRSAGLEILKLRLMLAGKM